MVVIKMGKVVFVFVLTNNDSLTNRLVRIFLYGHIIGENPLQVNMATFSRSE